MKLLSFSLASDWLKRHENLPQSDVANREHRCDFAEIVAYLESKASWLLFPPWQTSIWLTFSELADKHIRSTSECTGSRFSGNA